MITGCFSIGKIGETEIFRITQTHFVPLHYQHNEERISEVRKLLNSGTLYFSHSTSPNTALDLTLCAQRRQKTNQTDNRFFWYKILLFNILKMPKNTTFQESYVAYSFSKIWYRVYFLASKSNVWFCRS